MDPATAIETVVYSFTGGDDGLNPTGALTAIGGVLYGVTVYGGTAQSGTVFQFDPGTGAETVLHSFAGGKKDAAFPNNGLLNEGGTLYGTSTAGGTLGQGTVFAISIRQPAWRPWSPASEVTRFLRPTVPWSM